MSKKEVGSFLLLFLATLIWGTSFVAQTDSTEHIGPLGFMGARSLVGAFALMIIILLRNIGKGSVKNSFKKAFFPGVLCGIALAAATGLQQWGIYYNTVILNMDTSGIAGFLTALYIVFVPLFGLFFKRRIGVGIVFGSALCLVGMYLLFIGIELSASIGNFLFIGCALAFTFHILIIDIKCKDVDSFVLSFIQFFVAGIILLPISLFTESNIEISLKGAIIPIIYLGVFGSAIAYTIQIMVQKNLHPSVASLLMSFESVFAAISGALFLNERMNTTEILACAIIFTGIMCAQFGEHIFKIVRRKGARNG